MNPFTKEAELLTKADVIANAIVAQLPADYDSRAILDNHPAGWDQLLTALDVDSFEQRYEEVFTAIQVADSPEQRKKMALEWDAAVGARLDLWAEAYNCFYRALAQRQQTV